MPQSQIQTQTPTQCTCTSCPKFKNFHEPKGRGWCQVFDKVAYQHHQLTVDCQLNLPSVSTTDEEPDFCTYTEGDIVKLIDSHKHHSEWESFVVISKKYNHNRFLSDESYLNEPTWYVLIATIDKPIPDQYWKAETDLCHADHSAFIDTAEIF